MKSTIETTARRPGRRPFAAALALLALTGSSTLIACEGDNLFSGDAGIIQQGPPVVTSIAAPNQVREGEPLDLRIKVIAPRGLDELTVRYRRALNDQVQQSFEGRTDTVTVDLTVLVPAAAADSILVIEAYASDISGRVSEVFADTIRIISNSGLISSATLTPATASMGDAVMISARSAARQRIRTISRWG